MINLNVSEVQELCESQAVTAIEVVPAFPATVVPALLKVGGLAKVVNTGFPAIV